MLDALPSVDDRSAISFWVHVHNKSQIVLSAVGIAVQGK